MWTSNSVGNFSGGGANPEDKNIIIEELAKAMKADICGSAQRMQADSS